MNKLATILLFLASFKAYCQTPFSTKEYIDANNIKAMMLVHGDQWWDPDSQIAKCNFPATTAKNISFASALWMGGYDATNTLHVSSQTYRQDGNDYWPGPIDSVGSGITYSASRSWAKIWKITRADLATFFSYSTHDTSNTPQVILTWPGKGNAYARGYGGAPLSVTHDMAPFADLNGNGIYEPLSGEYPLFYGEQTLFRVFNDKGPNHGNSRGIPFGVEIKSTAFAFSRGTLIDNVVYYDYEITNRSTNNYHNFRLGVWNDVDLGYYLDDYIGFDSARRMGICYNGAMVDGESAAFPPNCYDSLVPVSGITVIRVPGDTGTTYVSLGSFTYFNNDMTSFGNPSIDTEFNFYLRSRARLGAHFKKDFVRRGVTSTGMGSGPDVKYVYDGDPGDTSKWSECNCQNAIGDRRYIISTDDFNLPAGATQHILMALVTTNRMRNNTCPNLVTFDGIREVADTAWNFYHHLPPMHVVPTVVEPNFDLYPNPATNQLQITTDFKGLAKAEIQVFNNIGQRIAVEIALHNSGVNLNTSSLAPGNYFIRITDNGFQKTLRFTKQ